jgi:hypothetical protein
LDVNEIIFEVTEEPDGGFIASAIGFGINTEADNLEELRGMVRDAVQCHFEKPPRSVRLRFVRDEVLAL